MARCCVKCSVKKACTSAAKLSGACVADLLMAVLPRIGEALEALADQAHQLRHAGEVPIGVGDLGVAEVGRQRQHALADVLPLLVPEHQPPDGEGMPKIMDARRAVTASIDPT